MVSQGMIAPTTNNLHLLPYLLCPLDPTPDMLKVQLLYPTQKQNWLEMQVSKYLYYSRWMPVNSRPGGREDTRGRALAH